MFHFIHFPYTGPALLGSKLIVMSQIMLVGPNLKLRFKMSIKKCFAFSRQM